MGIHILGRGYLSPGPLGRLAPCSQILLDHPQLQHKSLPHRSPAFGPILYKFIVMGLLGLDTIRCWAQSENCDLTIGTVCGKGCLCDDECNGLLRQDQVP